MPNDILDSPFILKAHYSGQTSEVVFLDPIPGEESVAERRTIWRWPGHNIGARDYTYIKLKKATLKIYRRDRGHHIWYIDFHELASNEITGEGEGRLHTMLQCLQAYLKIACNYETHLYTDMWAQGNEKTK